MTKHRDPTRAAAIRKAYDDGVPVKHITEDFRIKRGQLYRIVTSSRLTRRTNANK
jgi:DNA invertase Pin-like site-specific DNA recombinase